MVRIEVCVETPQEARAAVAAGADRIELCSALSEGGVTPSLGAVRRTRALIDAPLVVLLRPRGGDFHHPEDEIATLRTDLEILVSEGVDAVAIGALTPDGRLDAAAMRALMEASAGLEVVLHRAFDHSVDLPAAYRIARDLGVARILSSGGAADVSRGRDTLRELVAASSGGPCLVAAGGVTPETVADVVQHTGVSEVHLSAAALSSGRMRHRPDSPAMRSRPPEHEADRRAFSPERLTAVRKALGR